MHNGHSWRGTDLDGTVTRFSPPWYGPLPRKICGACAVGSGERSPIAADGQLLAFAADPDSFRQPSIVQIAESATWAVPNAFGDSPLVKDVDSVALMRLHRTAIPVADQRP